MYLQNSRILLGDGRMARMWEDHWSGNAPLKISFPNLYRAIRLKNGKVRDFVAYNTDGSAFWRFPTRRRRLRQVERVEGDQLAASILPPALVHDIDDEMVWISAGAPAPYSVHLQMEYLYANRRLKPGYRGLALPEKRVWRVGVPSKLNFLMWTVVWGRLPTRERLRHLGIDAQGQCPHCQQEPETDIHLLFSCPVARQFWRCLRSGFNARAWGHTSGIEAVHSWNADNLTAAGRKFGRRENAIPDMLSMYPPQ